MKVTFVTRADVHVSDVTPEMRKDDWRVTGIEKLRQINRIGEQVGASAILDAGDLFYLKSPLRNSHGLVSDLIRVHKEPSFPTWIVLGNHDIKHDNLTTVPGQPINVLHEAEALTLIGPEGAWVHGGLACSRGHVPNDSTALARTWVTGIPYERNLSVYDLKINIPSDPAPSAVVAVVHFFAQKGGGDFFGTQTLSYEDLREVFPRVNAWVFGHWHRDQGIEWIDGVPFINVGAVSRGALREENLDRQPKVARLSFEFDQDVLKSVEAEEITLQVQPAEAVFRIEQKDRVEQRMDAIHQFAEQLRIKTREIQDGAVADNLQSALTGLSEGVADEVVRLVKDYLRESA